MEEDVFRMVAEMKSRKKKGQGGLGENDVLVDMMGRMSESYSKLKKTNEELSSRCSSLEGQNKTLIKRVEELESELRGGGGHHHAAPPPLPPPQARAPTPEQKRERRSRFNKLEDRDEEMEKKERERSERRRREEAEQQQEVERERSDQRGGRGRREEPEEEMRSSSRRRFEEPPPEVEPPVRERSRRWDNDSRGEDRGRSPRDERREERTRFDLIITLFC